jgi:hypothetical protein
MATLTPTSPIVISTTASKTISSFTLLGVMLNSSANTVTIQYLSNLSTGEIEVDSVVQTGATATAFLATVADSGETIGALAIRAASAAIETLYSTSVTVS